MNTYTVVYINNILEHILTQFLFIYLNPQTIFLLKFLIFSWFFLIYLPFLKNF